MSPSPRKASLVLAALALGAAIRPAAATETDPALESAASLIAHSMAEARDTPLSETQDAGAVLTALRSSRDLALLPIFVKLEQSKVSENQIYGMVSAALLAKDPQRLDFAMLFKSRDKGLIGSVISALIDAGTITVPQLEKIVAEDTDDSQRIMAVAELQRRKALKDRAILTRFLNSDQDAVRYYAAITILENKDAPAAPAALAMLHDLSDKNDLGQANMQAVMLMRVQRDHITAAAPWCAQIASDAKNDEGLRYVAVGTLLALKNTDGPRILAEMIRNQHDMIEQVKLGLIALEYAADLKAAAIAPLLQSKSKLAQTIASLAQQDAGHDSDRGIDGLISLIKEGHPIVLDWALASTDNGDAARKMAVRLAIISQATIVDDVRGRDYERAATAAQRIMEEGGPEGRKLLAPLISGDNHAVAEAVLAGIYRADVPNESEIVLPAWPALSRSTSQEEAANCAALILAREGKTEALPWLSGMVMGGTVQTQGFRALAGWYYAKLLGKTAFIIQRATADNPH